MHAFVLPEMPNQTCDGNRSCWPVGCEHVSNRCLRVVMLSLLRHVITLRARPRPTLIWHFSCCLPVRVAYGRGLVGCIGGKISGTVLATRTSLRRSHRPVPRARSTADETAVR